MNKTLKIFLLLIGITITQLYSQDPPTFVGNIKTIMDALNDSTNNDTVILEPGYYDFNGDASPWVTLVEGKVLMGENDDVTFFRNISHYDEPFIKVNGNIAGDLKTSSITYGEIIQEKTCTKVKHPWLYVARLELEIGDKVALQGWSKSEAEFQVKQTLFTDVVDITSDFIILRDAITFSFDTKDGGGINFVKLKEMNVSISNIHFLSEQEQPSHHYPAISVFDYCYNVWINNCTFEQKKKWFMGIKVEESIVDISNCEFINLDRYPIQYLNTGFGSITDCKIEGCSKGIELHRTQSTIVSGNTIKNSKNKISGGAILISAFDPWEAIDSVNLSHLNLDADKSYFNIIERNYIDDIAYGNELGGSAGIHLNKRTNHNIIRNNTVMHCGLGIFVETWCNYNTISYNNCSYNNNDLIDPNRFGVGISIDDMSNYNLVTNNVCNYNTGWVKNYNTGGIGIEVRNFNCKYNQVINNVCENNGYCGMKINGDGTFVDSNVIAYNGQEVRYSDELEEVIENNDTINLYATRGYSRSELSINGDNIVATNNYIYGGTVYRPGTNFNYSVVKIRGNNIVFNKNIVASSGQTDYIILANLHCSEILTPSSKISINSNIIKGTTGIPSSPVLIHGASVYRPKHIDVLNNNFQTYYGNRVDVLVCYPKGYNIPAEGYPDGNYIDSTFQDEHRKGPPLQVGIIEGSTQY